MSVLVAVGGALVGVSLLVRAAFRGGRRRRPRPFPPALLRELSVHKRRCLGEPPDRVALELELLFGVAQPVGVHRPPRGPRGAGVAARRSAATLSRGRRAAPRGRG